MLESILLEDSSNLLDRDLLAEDVMLMRELFSSWAHVLLSLVDMWALLELTTWMMLLSSFIKFSLIVT